jgi:hypothetical protein
MAYTVRRRAETPFLEAFANGASIKEAASAAGIAESTAHRWLNLPQIKDRLNALRAERFLNTANEIISVTPLASNSLRQLLDCDKPWVALWAAGACLKFVVKLSQGLDVERNLKSLQRLVDRHGGKKLEWRPSDKRTQSIAPNPESRRTERVVEGGSKALISEGFAAEKLGFEMRAREAATAESAGRLDGQGEPGQASVPVAEATPELTHRVLVSTGQGDCPAPQSGEGVVKAPISEGFFAEKLGFEMRASQSASAHSAIRRTGQAAPEQASARWVGVTPAPTHQVHLLIEESKSSERVSKALISDGFFAEK